MEQLIGKMLDNRYEILSVVGTGGMAVVYKARCHKLNRLVAIKVLKEDLARDAEFRRRFHDESQAVAMLSNPNIVGVYDVSSSDGLEYIVMELIDGITLKQYMQKKNYELGWRESLHFITQIMKALSHAHSRGIIHRDIKPHNIMVLRDGSVKVADFGIARLMGAGHSTLTQEALGSVHYISPEQAKGSRIDERSDIYSAGVVLYEMITGRLPFEGDSAVSVAIQHINSIPLAPRELNPEIPEAMEGITLKAMAPDMEKRYASAEQMLLDLEQFRKNPEVEIDFAETMTAILLTDGQESEGDDTRVLTGVSSVSRAVGKRQKQQIHGGYEDDEDEKRDWKPTALALGLVAVFIVGIIVFLWTTFLSDLVNPKVAEYTVPELIGRTLEEVLADEEILSVFTVTQDKLTVTSEVEPGVILSQAPVKGTVLRGESPTVTVEVSTAEAAGIMPDIVNLEQRAAKIELESSAYRDLELVLDFQTIEHDDVTKNYVISTQPAKDEPLEKGQTVTIYVSAGPKIVLVTVPSFQSMTRSELEKALKNAGLQLGEVISQDDADAVPETVINQSIPFGEEVAEDTIIDFIFSNPAKDEPVETPPVISNITKTVTYPIDLPTDVESVKVVITIDGVETHSMPSINTNLKTIYPILQGAGVQVVNVYIDGELVSSQNVEFS